MVNYDRALKWVTRMMALLYTRGKREYRPPGPTRAMLLDHPAYDATTQEFHIITPEELRPEHVVIPPFAVIRIL